MNRKKFTLNEELFRMKQLFGHMGIPSNLITESGPGGPGTGTAIGDAIGSGTGTLVRTLGSEVVTSIENSLIKAAKENTEFLSKIGKDSSNLTIDDIKTAFKGATSDTEALGTIAGKNSTVYNEISNLFVEKLKPKTAEISSADETVKTVKSDLELASKNLGTDDNAWDTFADSLVILKQDVETVTDQAAKTKLNDIIETYETAVNTRNAGKNNNISFNEPIVTTKTTVDSSNVGTENHSKISPSNSILLPGGSKTNLFDTVPIIGSGSFTNWQPKIPGQPGKFLTMDEFNLIMSRSLEKIKNGELGWWSGIPIVGFDEVGCSDFQQYLFRKYINNELIIVKTDTKNNFWEIKLLNKDSEVSYDDILKDTTLGRITPPPPPKQAKVFANTKTTDGNIINKIFIATEDFKKGSPTPYPYKKLPETIDETQIVNMVKEETKRIIDWLKSDRYLNTRKLLTKETDEEIKKDIDIIINRIKNDLKIEFTDDQGVNWLGSAHGRGYGKDDTISIRPGTLKDIRGTFIHELGHYTSPLSYGTASGMNETIKNNLRSIYFDKFIKTEDKIIDSPIWGYFKDKNGNLLKDNFGKPITNLRKFYDNIVMGDQSSYLLWPEELRTRLYRTMDWLKKQENFSIEKEITLDDAEKIWDRYEKYWKKGKDVEGNWDIIKTLQAFELTNPSTIPFTSRKNYIKKLKDLLNITLGLAALLTLSEYSE